MRQNTLITYIVLFLVLNLLSTAFSEEKYGIYTNNDYNYEIIIPQSWSKDKSTLPDKHFIIIKNGNAEIKVRAFRSPKEDIDAAVHSKTWDLRNADPTLTKIIETEKIEIKKNITGKLLIFEYKSKKDGFLQRVLITKNNGITYIIECKAPRKIFYKFDDIFITAFASFKYIKNISEQSKQEAKEELKEESDKDEAGKDTGEAKNPEEELQQEESLEEEL